MRKILLFSIFNLLITNSFAQSTGSTDNTSKNEPPDTAAVKARPKARKAVSIGPLTLYYKLGAGKDGKQTITFINNTISRVSFTLETADWDLDSMGQDVYYNPGALSTSCARWITLDKTFVDVMPHSKETVTATMTLPDSVEVLSESKWSLIFIKSMAEKKAPIKSEDGSVVLEPKREVAIVARVYQTPANTGQLVKELKMLGLERTTSQVPGDSATYYRVTCKNVGNTLLMSNFTIDLSSAETGQKYSVTPVKTMLLPGRTRNVDLKLPPNLPKGKYVLVAMIAAEDEDVPVEAAQKDIEID